VWRTHSASADYPERARAVARPAGRRGPDGALAGAADFAAG
jgi:hypothetical protein